jgi:Ala-tRNA(Pro) deacylase
MADQAKAYHHGDLRVALLDEAVAMLAEGGVASVTMRALGQRLGAGRLSFGSAERLMKNLGVIPGAVTPFAVVNDRQGAVGVVLDEALLAHDPVNCHPLVNTMTTAISARDLVRFLESEGHPPRLIDLDAP